jgi:hypothetical protein
LNINGCRPVVAVNANVEGQQVALAQRVRVNSRVEQLRSVQMLGSIPSRFRVQAMFDSLLLSLRKFSHTMQRRQSPSKGGGIIAGGPCGFPLFCYYIKDR